MQAPIDYYTDANQQKLYAIDRLYGLPAFVKAARAESPEEIGALKSGVFADVRHRRFPCHNKSATWLAQAYFSLVEPVYSKKEAAFIQDRIDKSAKFFSVSSLCDGFKRAWVKIADTDIPELEDSDYALVTNFENHKIRRFPIHSPLSVKSAASYLYANRFKYPYEWRKTAARNILKRVIHFDGKAKRGVKYAGAAFGECKFEPEIQDYLERASGYGMSLPRDAAAKVASRVYMLSDHKHPEMKERLAKIAQALCEMDIRQATPELYQKMAAVIDAVDREAGLCAYYHEGVDMPEDIFFDILQKQAADMLESNITLTTGASYPVAMFSDLPLSKIADVLGKDFADAISDGLGQVDAIKFAEVARTLPRPDAAILEKAISAGMKEAALIKDARAGRMANESFDKESVKRKLEAEGKKVSEGTDFQLVAKLR